MNGVETLSPERIAEIKAFKNTDFSDCPVMTEEELKKLRPRHPEYYKQENQAVQNCFDAQPSPQAGEGSPLDAVVHG